MNAVVNKLFLAGGKFVPEINLIWWLLCAAKRLQFSDGKFSFTAKTF